MTKLTDLPEATAVAQTDQLYLVDTSDTTQDPAGTSKRVPLSNIKQTILARVKIAEISNPAGGTYDFQSVPPGFSRLILQGMVYSTYAGAELDVVEVFINGATDANGNHRQNLNATDGGGSFNEVANSATVAICACAGSLAGVGPSAFDAIIFDPDGSDPKIARGVSSVRRASGDVQGGMMFSHSAVTAAIANLQVKAPNGTLSGTVTLYGEKEIEVLALP